MTGFAYPGNELELFKCATVWKAYVRRRIATYVGNDVLEVGAGFGGTTALLCRAGARRWVCLEPDAGLARRLARSIAEGELPECCQVVVGTLESGLVPSGFDTVLYIDVLEHIEDDREELERAAGRLEPGGHLVVLSPAHPWLYTPFDRAIGHHRRYTRATLRALAPPGCDLVRLDYLDAVGLVASLGNRLVLSRSLPSRAQIAVWDKLMVPLSKVCDPLFGNRVGKSVLAVWRKRG